MSIAFILVACTDPDEPGVKNEVLSFNEHIRPILNKNCVGCHGGVTKQGGISYIYRDQAIARGNSGRLNIVPHNARASEFIQRIKSTDPARRMPYKRPALSDEEIALLERWIDEGATWEEHWAFIPPVAVAPPELDDRDWGTSPIDAFVLDKMRAQGLEPNPHAEPLAWLRRASLDLTGLPPSEAEIAEFLASLSDAAGGDVANKKAADGEPPATGAPQSELPPTATAHSKAKRQDAYQKVVDRLLASPAFGERWASVWLDLARYSDSRGYERDRHRDAWPYRDWLINAFNDDMPYDDFVTKQLAGDLLPDADLSDHIATAFHRLTPANDEAGTDDEEYRTYAVMDRSATTWSAINGISMNCVQCHAHPYDPISHEEYFHSLAFFNTTDDADRRADDPLLKVAYDSRDNATVFEQQRTRADLRKQLFAEVKHWQTSQTWRPLAIASAVADEGLAAHALAEIKWLSLGQPQRQSAQHCYDAQATEGKSATLAQADIAECEGEISKSTALYRDFLAAADAQARLTPAAVQDQLAEHQTSLHVENGELHEAKLGIPAVASYQIVTAAHQGEPSQLAAIALTSSPLRPADAVHSPQDGFTIEGIHAELLRSNGERTPLSFAQFVPSSVYAYEQMLDLHAKRAKQAPVEASAIGANWFTGFSAHLHAHPVTTTAVLQTPVVLQPGDRLRLSLAQLQRDHSRGEKPYYLRQLALAYAEKIESTKAQQLIERSIALTLALATMKTASVPVMREQIESERRSTRLFHRGNLGDKRGDDIAPRTPQVFPVPLPEAGAARPSRLDLARWFFDDQQPLTARVAVNRFWAELFGQGIVTTLGDFGSIGASPSHPQLLDWLARYFQDDLDWDIKALLRTITLSSTYRQSAQLSEEKLARDPNNRFLARGPYQRLSAEMVRDQALLAAGLLSSKRGGVSVMPPQPPGVWQTVYNKDKWVDASGEDRFRRALYTYNKRTSPYPSFILFDDAGHLTSASQRFITNTPLQALVTLNDIVYVEAAQSLGKLLHQTAEQHGAEQAIKRGFLRVTSRHARAEELSVLAASLGKFARDAKGESQAAAWTNIASIVLNLDASLKR